MWRGNTGVSIFLDNVATSMWIKIKLAWQDVVPEPGPKFILFPSYTVCAPSGLNNASVPYITTILSQDFAIEVKCIFETLVLADRIYQRKYAAFFFVTNLLIHGTHFCLSRRTWDWRRAYRWLGRRSNCTVRRALFCWVVWNSVLPLK